MGTQGTTLLVLKKIAWPTVLQEALCLSGVVDPGVTHFSKFGGTPNARVCWGQPDFSRLGEVTEPRILAERVGDSLYA